MIRSAHKLQSLLLITSQLMAFQICLPLLGSEPESNPANLRNWTNWRGPTYNGAAAANTRPPIKWDANTNVKWVATIPGEGSSTPVIWENQMFVLSAEATDRQSSQPAIIDPNDRTSPPNVYYKFIVTSLDRQSGRVLWQKVAAEQVPHEGKHQTHTYAAGSPVTDGQRLFASFASRGIYAYSLDGQLLWQVDLGDMQTRFGWGEAVTPVVVGDKLIVNWDQEKGSFIAALDATNGNELWRVERPEEATSWNTPLIVKAGERSLVVVNGTHRVKAYDVSNGREVWACGGQTVNAIPSPVQFQNTVIALSGFKGSAGMSIPIGSQGDVTGSPTINWQISQGTPYVPSPSLSGRRLYFTQANANVLSVVDALTGESLVERKRLTGVETIYASPLVAGGYVYIADREGNTVVIRDDTSLEIVAVNSLGEPIDASPVAIDNQLFLRTLTKVYCIESADK